MIHDTKTITMKRIHLINIVYKIKGSFIVRFMHLAIYFIFSLNSCFMKIVDINVYVPKFEIKAESSKLIKLLVIMSVMIWF